MNLVTDYLQKIKNSFIVELNKSEEELLKFEISLKENKKFISLLEESEDTNYDAFSPRSVDYYQKRKINELKNEQKEILDQIRNIKNNIKILQSKISEIDDVIMECEKMHY